MDGEVIIKVSADTKSFDNDMEQVKNDANRVIGELNGKEIVLKSDKGSVQDTVKGYEQIDTELDKLFEDYIQFQSELYQTNNNLSDSSIINYSDDLKKTGDEILKLSGLIGENGQETIKYAKEIATLDAQLKDLVYDYDTISKKKITSDEDLERLETLKKQIEATRLELEKLNGTSIHIKGIDQEIKNVDDSSNKTLKSMARWGLAIFGVRSAYAGIRQAMSSVLAGNDKMKKQYDGMKQSFYNAFAPIIEKIINLMRTLMAYVNYVWQRLFHHALFAEKGVLNASKKSKELQKQLAGFDEANVLSDNKNNSSESGAYDLGLSDIKIPDWLKKIMDWVDKYPTISKIIFGLAAFTLFGGWKLASGIGTAIKGILGGGKGEGSSGLLGILGTMALIAATVVVCKITYDQVKKAWRAYKDLKEAQEESNKTVKNGMDNSNKRIQQIIDETSQLDKNNEQHKRNIDTIYKLIAINDDFARKDFNNKKNQEIAEKGYQEMLAQTVTELDNMRRAGEMTEEEQYDYYKFLKTYLTPEQINNAEKLGLTAKEAYNLRNGFKDLDKKFTTKYEVETQQARDKFDSFISNIKKGLLKPIEFNLKANITGLSDKVTSVLKTLGVFHADGGIVNLPGRGVPITHYAGEAGREGIIPMDNVSQMSLLGQEIAKYVNINNVVNNYMDARKINTLLQQSTNKERLANNG